MYIYFVFIVVGFIFFMSTLFMMLWFKANRILNVYVIVISFVSCLYFIVHGLSNIKPSIGINSLFLFINYSQFILILSPALFLFFQKSIANIKFFEKKDIIQIVKLAPISKSIIIGTLNNRIFTSFRTIEDYPVVDLSSKFSILSNLLLALSRFN